MSNYHNIMAFPAGPICNLACQYCYYLDKTQYYPHEKQFNMGYQLLEEYTKQYIAGYSGTVITFGWQGGEPALRGIEFYRKAVAFQRQYARKGMQIQNSFQTNGTLLDDEWCEFFAENEFLIGISLDGSQRLHDKYRLDKNRRPTYARVVNALRLLQKHKVEYNVLCAVNDFNQDFPLEVYDSLRELGVGFMQFIPIVVQDGQGRAGAQSVTPEKYGRFLIRVFNRWLTEDYGKVYVQIFEEAVRAWIGMGSGLCVFSQTCGAAPVMEYNGDVYACDHFVFPQYKLGNINETPLYDLVNMPQQRQFGLDKYETLPQTCLDCPILFVCHGGCPKNRISGGDKPVNYLCQAYKMFFSYTAPYMRIIALGIKGNESPHEVHSKLMEQHGQIWDIGRNEPCPCGSGLKYKRCCAGRMV